MKASRLSVGANGVPVKTCCDCGEPYPLDVFPVKQRSKTGVVYRGPRCRGCHNRYFQAVTDSKRRAGPLRKAYMKAYAASPERRQRCHDKYWADPQKFRRLANESHGRSRARNPELKHAQSRKWNQSEKGKRYHEAWHAKRPDYKSTYNRTYRERNGDQLRAYDRARTKLPERQEQARNHRAKRRAQRLATRVDPKIPWKTIIERDHSTCYLCGDLLTAQEITFDHVVPLTRGGAHTERNLKVACMPCNGRKGNRLLAEYIALYPLLVTPTLKSAFP